MIRKEGKIRSPGCEHTCDGGMQISQSKELHFRSRENHLTWLRLPALHKMTAYRMWLGLGLG